MSAYRVKSTFVRTTLVVGLVGSVDVGVDLADVVEVEHRDAGGLQAQGGAVGTRHRAHELDAPGATVTDLFNHLAPIETFTALFNGTGHPAVSLPLQVSRAGLPVGMQFVAPFGQEARLLRLAAALEQAQPWRTRRPGIHAST